MIKYEAAAGVGRITLNRPEKRNAFTRELPHDLSASLDRAAEESDVRVVVISGAGQDFCSGMDLALLAEDAAKGVDSHIRTARALVRLYLSVRNHPKPVIAAVRGRALGGGCGLAMACDLVLAAESAQFGYPEVNVGFVPAIVMSLLRRSVGEKRAFELLATGEIVSALDALAIGMITRVYPDADFDVAVEAYAASLKKKSASALGLTKKLLYAMDGMSFEAALEAGVQANALARMTQDAQRGFEEFTKRKK